ncbi:MAG: hypothetical protein EZS28_016947 [Streblomastix strix]|uniref:Uncharacterized protein n=1 Tax=Streblomastix strix TaxID=222440 RepID=A0A5J4VY74_9EUKA|nr:MAG: hypothetical protein EZS28_016947 [Streblomastix strix]
MESYQEVQISANDITSFTDSYEQNKQRIENEQSEFESKSSLVEILASLLSLRDQIQNNNTSKSVIQIPNLVKSLITLSTFRTGTHLREEIDLQRIQIRHWSRECLSQIQVHGDAYVQSELVRQGYGRVMSILYCKAGGKGEEQDYEIYNGLINISIFLREQHDGRNYDYSSFQPLPLLARTSLEQIEDEGANEEIETQMKNNGYNGFIKAWAIITKEVILNHFIHKLRR